MARLVFFDLETSNSGSAKKDAKTGKEKVLDIGACDNQGGEFHKNDKNAFTEFIKSADYLCGHNIFEHDLNYISDIVAEVGINKFIDTILWSPLLFPSKPYHKLGKNYKLVSEDDLNNPYLDSRLVEKLFGEELQAFKALDKRLKNIFYILGNG